MKLKRRIYIWVCVIVVIFAVNVYAGQLNLLVKYPIVDGFLDELRVKTKIELPCYQNSSAKPTENFSLYLNFPDGRAGCI